MILRKLRNYIKISNNFFVHLSLGWEGEFKDIKLFYKQILLHRKIIITSNEQQPVSQPTNKEDNAYKNEYKDFI